MEFMSLINCPECDKEVSEKAPTCPNCGSPIAHPPMTKKEKKKADAEAAKAEAKKNWQEMSTGRKIFNGIGMLFLVGMFGFGWWIMLTDDSASPAKPKAQDFGSEAGAYAWCQTMVESRLKSPATADFPWRAVHMLDHGDGRYQMRSHVDSQNSLGATVRSTWICGVEYTDGKWNLTELTID